MADFLWGKAFLAQDTTPPFSTSRSQSFSPELGPKCWLGERAAFPPGGRTGVSGSKEPPANTRMWAEGARTSLSIGADEGVILEGGSWRPGELGTFVFNQANGWGEGG